MARALIVDTVCVIDRHFAPPQPCGESELNTRALREHERTKASNGQFPIDAYWMCVWRYEDPDEKAEPPG
jgi:hypothetical protein